MKDFFNFKHFSVLQGNVGMKVNTDSVLLGAWAKTENVETVLDVGTGNGLLALMIAQRTHARITAIDINCEACMVALQNMLNSPWKERISIICTSFQDYYQNHNQKFDLIISNPPYFNNGLKNKSDMRANARHTQLLSYEELIEGAVKLLSEKGSFCLILPVEEKENFLKQALFKNLSCNEIVEIKPRINEPVKRVLMRFSLQNHILKYASMTIQSFNARGYTDEYRELTKEFYLQF